MICEIFQDNCNNFLRGNKEHKFDLTFLDPPFNQGKDYYGHDDNMNTNDYWDWMKNVCSLIYQNTSDGGAIYFMQREKNARQVLDALEFGGWTFQNLIIWKKKASAVPQSNRFGKQYQIIAFAIKGKNRKVFNRLRIDPPLLVTDKYQREKGMYVTDVWDDIRELTSGYFAGDEPLRYENGERVHKQQSPVQLLTRIILASSKIDDMIFDPFAGTGTTLLVAKQLQRNSIGVELNTTNVSFIRKRISELRKSDNILKFRKDYEFTENLDIIWQITEKSQIPLPKTSKEGTLTLNL